MSIRGARVLVVLAACLVWLGGCSSSAKLSDLWGSKGGDLTGPPASDAPATTGSIVTQPAEADASGEPVQPLAKPGLLGDDPNDDLQLGKKYFRANSFGLAEKTFRSAVEHRPQDAEAWVDLAATYDRLHRFDLADRAYAEAIRLIGPTAEILNDQGFSYMLRGDYTRAHQKLEQAQAKDPANPYVQANLQLLDDAFRKGKAIQ